MSRKKASDHFFDNRQKRYFTDLSEEEKEVINNIQTIKDIYKLDILNEWTDDNLMCRGIFINEVYVGLWWLSNKSAAELDQVHKTGKASNEFLDILKKATSW